MWPAQRIPAAVLAEPPEVAPLEAAEVLLAGLGHVPFQRGPGVRRCRRPPRHAGQAHVGGIEQAARLVGFPGGEIRLFRGDLSLGRFLLLGSPGDVLLPFCRLPFPGDPGKADQENQHQSRRQTSHHRIATAPPPGPFRPPHRPGQIGSPARNRASSSARAAAEA